MMALLQHAHGGDPGMELAYFWASILTALLPISAFTVLGFFVVRGYFRRSEPDGGGPPPLRNADCGLRIDGKDSATRRTNR
jgi:hypothetical protein